MRDLTAVETLLHQGRLHVAMERPVEARAAAAEAETIGPAGVSAEVSALLADQDGDDAALQAALDQAVTQPGVSWWVPYRLATLLSTSQDRAATERLVALLRQSTAANPNVDYAWTFLGEALAALGRADDAIAAGTRGVALMPASSAHRLALARTYLRLGRPADGLKVAGIGRALATSAEDLTEARRVLSALAAASTPAETPPLVVDHPGESPAAPATPLIGAAAEPVAADDIGGLINQCYEDHANCARVLTLVAQDCKASRTVTSTAACREAGYIVDAGVGVPARPALAADYYLLGCTRLDELSCVRLATLRSLGRGVPRDGAAALAVLAPSCERGTQEACYRLGLHLSVTGVAADRQRAREVFEASCQAGFPESCAALRTLPPGR